MMWSIVGAYLIITIAIPLGLAAIYYVLRVAGYVLISPIALLIWIIESVPTAWTEWWKQSLLAKTIGAVYWGSMIAAVVGLSLGCAFGPVCTSNSSDLNTPIIVVDAGATEGKVKLSNVNRDMLLDAMVNR